MILRADCTQLGRFSVPRDAGRSYSHLGLKWAGDSNTTASFLWLAVGASYWQDPELGLPPACLVVFHMRLHMT